MALSLRAQTTVSTNSNVRPISLEESVRLALDHNLRIRIEKHNTRIAQFTLAGSYGYYDPVFAVTAERFFYSTEGRFNATTGVLSTDSTATADTLSPRLSGVLPTGLKYDLTGDFQHSRGSRGGNNPFDDYITGTAITLRQPLLKDFWIDAARTDIKVSKKNLKISEYGLQFELMRTIRDVQQAYYELIAARDSIKVQEKALELAQQFLTENKQRVKVGTMSPLDEIQAQSQAATSLADLIAAKRAHSAQENVLKSLITGNFEQWHTLSIQPTESLVAIPESYNLGSSWIEGLKLRPDFNQVKEEVEKRGILVRFRHNQLFPTLDLIGGYGRNGLDTTDFTPAPFGRTAGFGGSLDDISAGRNPKYNVGAVFSVPLGNRSAKSNWRVAKEEMALWEDRLKSAHQTIIIEIDDAVKQAQASFEGVTATREARRYAESALDAEVKKLENGKSTSFQVLKLQKDLTDARFKEIRALAEYNKALSQLYFSEGTTLSRNRVNLDVK